MVSLRSLFTSSILAAGLTTAHGNSKKTCPTSQVTPACYADQWETTFPPSDIKITGATWVQDNIYDVTLSYQAESLDLENLTELKIIGLNSPNGGTKLVWSLNSAVYDIDNPAKWTTTLRVYTKSSKDDCYVEMYPFQIQVDWCEAGASTKGCSAWKWPKSYDYDIGCDNMQDGVSRKHHPVYQWPKKCSSDCGVEPTTSDEPEEPTTSDEPEEPTTSDEPEEPTTSDEPEEPTTSDKPEEPTTSDEPEEPTTSDEPEEPTTSDEPEEPTTSDEPEEPTTSDEPEEPTTSDEPEEPTTSDEPEEPTTSDEPEEPTTSEEEPTPSGEPTCPPSEVSPACYADQWETTFPPSDIKIIGATWVEGNVYDVVLSYEAESLELENLTELKIIGLNSPNGGTKVVWSLNSGIYDIDNPAQWTTTIRVYTKSSKDDCYVEMYPFQIQVDWCEAGASTDGCDAWKWPKSYDYDIGCDNMQDGVSRKHHPVYQWPKKCSPDCGVEPTTSDEPEEPTTSDEPEEPTTSDEPEEPTTSDEPEEPTTSDEPEEPTTSDEPEEPTTSDEPEEPTTSDEPEEPTTSDEPEEPTTSDEPEEPTTSDEPEEPTTSDEPEEPTTSEEEPTPSGEPTCPPSEVSPACYADQWETTFPPSDIKIIGATWVEGNVYDVVLSYEAESLELENLTELKIIGLNSPNGGTKVVWSLNSGIYDIDNPAQWTTTIRVYTKSSKDDCYVEMYPFQIQVDWCEAGASTDGCDAWKWPKSYDYDIGCDNMQDGVSRKHHPVYQWPKKCSPDCGVEPTTSDEPEEPTTSDEPEEPTTSDEPEEPTTSDEPEEPTTSDEPEEPTTSDEPEEPTTSDEPEEPTTSDEPEEPTTSDEPEEPTTSDEPEEPTTSDEPEEPTTSDEPEEPTTSDEPEEPTTSDEPEEPTTSDEPEEPTTSDEPEEPTTSDEPEEPTTSDEPEEPTTSDEPKEPTTSEEEPGTTEKPVEPTTKTVTDVSTTLLTVTDCGTKTCTKSLILTGVTKETVTVHGRTTVVTTYCPLPTETVKPTPVTVTSTIYADESVTKTTVYTTGAVEKTVTVGGSSAVVVVHTPLTTPVAERKSTDEIKTVVTARPSTTTIVRDVCYNDVCSVATIVTGVSERTITFSTGSVAVVPTYVPLVESEHKPTSISETKATSVVVPTVVGQSPSVSATSSIFPSVTIHEGVANTVKNSMISGAVALLFNALFL